MQSLLKSVLYIFLLLMAFCNKVYSGESYYRSIQYPNKTFSISKNGDMTLIGLAYDASTCNEDSKFLCINSSIFNFYVLKNIGEQTSWIVDGVNYKVLSNALYPVFGNTEKDNVYYIKGTKGLAEITYLFSEERGLLMFYSETENGLSIYILSNFCGFGALNKCWGKEERQLKLTEHKSIGSEKKK